MLPIIVPILWGLSIGLGLSTTVGVVYAIYEELNEEKLKEALRMKKEFAGRITKVYKSDGYNNVNVGLLDENMEERGDLPIRAKSISSDIYVGAIIYA